MTQNPKKRVYIAYTGGTIGMARNATGAYAPQPGFLEEQLRQIPELADPSMPTLSIHEYQPLLDSSDMTPAHWLAIAKDIHDQHEQYDGFVILHGTDTMAYTASALSFLLHTPKTIVVTGSQIPLCELRNDARENLITSIVLAANHRIPEVILYFGGRVLRGNRSLKADTEGLLAFESPNHPALGEAGIRIEINDALLQPAPPHTTRLGLKNPNPTIAALRLFPGINASTVANMLQPPLQGLVLEAYGSGNGPSSTPGFLDAIREATARGVVVVACTQCVRGQVDLGAYATSLAAAGVVSGFDLTVEAALAKLYALLGLGLSPQEVRARMQAPWRGEMTV